MIIWAQLGLHKKPIAVLNIDGFYNDLIKLVLTMADKGFLKQINQEMLLVSDNIDELLEKMRNYQAPTVGSGFLKRKFKDTSQTSNLTFRTTIDTSSTYPDTLFTSPNTF